MNIVILAAILVQGLIAKKNQVIGAVIGLLITIGIAIWGISLYSDGDAIAFFTIPLSEGVFYIFIAGWTIYDVVMIVQSVNGKMSIRLATETNIYTTPDINSDVVAVKSRGHVLQALRNVKKVNGTEWLKVTSTRGEEGYILGSTPILRKFNTLQKETHIYSRANASSDVLETVAKGGQIQLGETITIDGTTWIQVSTNHTEVGYIDGNTRGQVVAD